MVLAAIQRQIGLVEGLAQLIDQIDRAPAARAVSGRLESSLRAHGQALERVTAIRAGLYMDWKNGDITREEYHSLKQALEEKQAQLGRDIACLEKEIHAAAQAAASSDPFFEAFRRCRNIPWINRGIVAELIKAVHIHEGGDVDIDFSFADPCGRVIL